MLLFSSSDRTGPRSVTFPSCVMILTLWAYVESALSSWIALRIFCVISRSAGFIFWSSAVGLLLSLFCLVLSGGVCCGSWLLGTGPAITDAQKTSEPTGNSHRDNVFELPFISVPPLKVSFFAENLAERPR